MLVLGFYAIFFLICNNKSRNCSILQYHECATEKKQQKIPLCFYYLFSTCVKALEKSIYHVNCEICMCVYVGMCIFPAPRKSMRNKNEFHLSCQITMRFPLEIRNELIESLNSFMPTVLLLMYVRVLEAKSAVQ